MDSTAPVEISKSDLRYSKDRKLADPVFRRYRMTPKFSAKPFNPTNKSAAKPPKPLTKKSTGSGKHTGPAKGGKQAKASEATPHCQSPSSRTSVPGALWRIAENENTGWHSANHRLSTPKQRNLGPSKLPEATSRNASGSSDERVWVMAKNGVMVLRDTKPKWRPLRIREMVQVQLW
jgi:hypothetical protein